METTLVKADAKGRLTVRGVVKGRKYMVSTAPDGWWVSAAPKMELSSGMERVIADTWEKLGPSPGIDYDKLPKG